MAPDPLQQEEKAPEEMDLLELENLLHTMKDRKHSPEEILFFSHRERKDINLSEWLSSRKQEGFSVPDLKHVAKQDAVEREATMMELEQSITMLYQLDETLKVLDREALDPEARFRLLSIESMLRDPSQITEIIDEIEKLKERFGVDLLATGPHTDTTPRSFGETDISAGGSGRQVPMTEASTTDTVTPRAARPGMEIVDEFLSFPEQNELDADISFEDGTETLHIDTSAAQRDIQQLLKEVEGDGPAGQTRNVRAPVTTKVPPGQIRARRRTAKADKQRMVKTGDKPKTTQTTERVIEDPACRLQRIIRELDTVLIGIYGSEVEERRAIIEHYLKELEERGTRKDLATEEDRNKLNWIIMELETIIRELGSGKKQKMTGIPQDFGMSAVRQSLTGDPESRSNLHEIEKAVTDPRLLELFKYADRKDTDRKEPESDPAGLPDETGTRLEKGRSPQDRDMQDPDSTSSQENTLPEYEALPDTMIDCIDALLIGDLPAEANYRIETIRTLLNEPDETISISEQIDSLKDRCGIDILEIIGHGHDLQQPDEDTMKTELPLPEDPGSEEVIDSTVEHEEPENEVMESEVIKSEVTGSDDGTTADEFNASLERRIEAELGIRTRPSDTIDSFSEVDSEEDVPSDINSEEDILSDNSVSGQEDSGRVEDTFSEETIFDEAEIIEDISESKEDDEERVEEIPDSGFEIDREAALREEREALERERMAFLNEQERLQQEQLRRQQELEARERELLEQKQAEEERIREKEQEFSRSMESVLAELTQRKTELEQMRDDLDSRLADIEKHQSDPEVQEAKLLQTKRIDDIAGEVLEEAILAAKDDGSIGRVAAKKRDRMETILSLIINKNVITRPVVEKICKVSQPTAERDLGTLRTMDLIIYTGSPKTGSYVLTDKTKELMQKQILDNETDSE